MIHMRPPSACERATGGPVAGALDRIEQSIGDRADATAAVRAAVAELSGRPSGGVSELVDQIHLWFRAVGRERARALTASAIADHAGAERRRFRAGASTPGGARAWNGA